MSAEFRGNSSRTDESAGTVVFVVAVVSRSRRPVVFRRYSKVHFQILQKAGGQQRLGGLNHSENSSRHDAACNEFGETTKRQAGGRLRGMAAGAVFLLLRGHLSNEGVADVRYKSDLGLTSQQWEKKGRGWGQISGWKARAAVVCPEVGQVSGDSSVNVPYDDTRSPCCSVSEMPCKNGICLRCQVTGLAFRRRGRFLAI